MPNETKHELLLIKRLRERGFSDEQIEAIINTLNSVCPRCWDTPTEKTCYCEADD